MSPDGIVLFEIDESFGPNVLAEYYLSTMKVSSTLLKDFEEKHVKKDIPDIIILKDKIRYYSGKIENRTIDKDNLYLSFILKPSDDIISIKSIFDTIEDKINSDYSADRKQMDNLLKTSLNSIMSLMEKLKEPAIIVDTINEKTKLMLDEGELQGARELIDLGEKIPEKLAEEITLAETMLQNKYYKKAKKSYIKAADLAEIIQENEIVTFLRHKAEEAGSFPDLIKNRDQLTKDISKIVGDIQDNQLYLYHQLINPLNKLLNTYSALDDQNQMILISDLITNVSRADKIAKELFNLDKKIIDSMVKL